MSSRVSQYPGLRNNRRRRAKYEDCRFRTVQGIDVRALSQVEIDEFKARINAILDPSLRVTPKYRRSVV